MSSNLFARDSNGTRITTNILVYGYIAEICKTYQLLIPDDIKKIIFALWLTNIQMESSKIEQLNTTLMRYFNYMGRQDEYRGKFWWFCDEYGIDDDLIDEEVQAAKEGTDQSALTYFYDEYEQEFPLPLQDDDLSEDQKRKAVVEIIIKCYEHPNWDWEAEAMLPKCRYCIHIYTNAL